MNIHAVVYTYSKGNETITENLTTLSGHTWTKEITVPAGTEVIHIGANAIGVLAASVLKVQIYVDGVLKKEGVSTGEVMSAQTMYNF